jgi:hypothetical protein
MVSPLTVMSASSVSVTALNKKENKGPYSVKKGKVVYAHQILMRFMVHIKATYVVQNIIHQCRNTSESRIGRNM